MELAISFVWTAMECVGMLFFLDSFFTRRFRKEKHISLAMIWWCLILVVAMLRVPNIPRQILSVVITMVISILLYRGSWYYSSAVGLLDYLLLAIFDAGVLYGISALLDKPITELIWEKEIYIVIVTTGKLLFIFSTWMLRRMRYSEATPFASKKWTILLLLFPLISLGMLIVLFNFCIINASFAPVVLAFSAILGIANICMIYVITQIEKSARMQQENLLLTQQMSIQVDNITALERAYRAQRSASHDYKKHLSAVQYLLAENDINTAESYIEELLREHSTRVFCVNTHHPAIDAVLNQKYQCAQELGISVQFRVNDLSKVKIPISALVVLLSNLFDNAIEACQQCDGERSIICVFVLNDDQIFLSMRNTSNPVSINNNLIRSTKKPYQEHGFGLLNIQRIIQQAGGDYTVAYCDGWFQFSAEIPNSTFE